MILMSVQNYVKTNNRLRLLVIRESPLRKKQTEAEDMVGWSMMGGGGGIF